MLVISPAAKPPCAVTGHAWPAFGAPHPLARLWPHAPNSAALQAIPIVSGEVFDLGQVKKRADGYIEKKRKINGKVVHFYGKTAREVQRKIDEALENAAKAKEVLQNAKPRFATREEYFAAQDALILDCKAVTYGEEGKAELNWK